MEQNPSHEANSPSASQEVPLLIWKPKFYYHVHKSPPLLLILIQKHLVSTFPTLLPQDSF